MAKLKVEKRSGIGKYKSFDLRKAGKIPGVIYGKGLEENVNVSIVLKEFLQIIKSGDRLIDLDVDGKVMNVLLKAVQHGTYDHEILHADFRSVSANEVIEVLFDIELHGADESIGVQEGGMIEQSLHQINAKCLPRNLPEKVVLDVSGMKIGDILYVEDLPTFDGVEYAIHGNPSVVSCHQPAAAEEEETTDEEEAATPEVIGEKEREEKDKE